MDTLEFKVQINAPRNKVWEKLWSDEGYRAWTSVFFEGSYAESDWQEGSKILFLTPKGDGMFGVIKQKVDNEAMVFEHKGELKNGVEEAKDWGGAQEAYFLNDAGGSTELTVQLQAASEFATYFNDTFPKALQAVKRISEES